MKLTKSFKNILFSLKKSEEEYLHFPSGKEHESRFSEDAGDFPEEADKNIEAFKQLQDNERKWEFRAGQAELEGKPVTILDTRMLGKNAPRLRALVVDEDGKTSIHQIHRLDKIKLDGFSEE